MDELELLRGFRADLPSQPPTARSAARRRVLRGVRPRRRAPRKTALALAVTVAAGGAAVAVLSGLDEGHVAPASATARQALQRVAAVAERRAGPGVPRDDQFFYVASEGTEMVTSIYGDGPHQSFSYLYTKRREIWLSVDRTGELRDRQVGPVRWVTPADRRDWVAKGRPSVTAGQSRPMHMPAVHGYHLGEERLTSAQLRAYDPTPQELFDRLRARVGDAGQSPNGEIFVQIADALRESPQPPRLRATLYRALALVPGVQFLGNVHDRLGRAAVGVAYTEHTGLRQELLFDPETSEVLNERQVVVHPVQGLKARVGTAIEDIVYTKRAVTDATVRP
jgi:hypothetical protein